MGKNGIIMKNRLFTFTYQSHKVTVDLGKIIAINHPNADDKYFCIHFTSVVWKVAADQHDKVYKAWWDFNNNL